MVFTPCFAQPRVPPVVPNATLLTLLLFTRHGARVPFQHWESPDVKYEWHCGENYYKRNHRIPLVNGVPTNFSYNSSEKHSFGPSCNDGSLLDQGVQQHINLGASFRKYLVDQTHLLPEQFNSQLIYVRSSYALRCIESGVAFIDGLYPPLSEGETLYVKTNDPDNEPLSPSPTIFKKKIIEFRDTDYVKNHIERFDRMMQPVADYFNITFHDPFEKILLGDFVNTFRCNEQPYPNDLVDPLLDMMLNDSAVFVDGFPRYVQPDTDKPLIELLLNEIDAFYSGNKKSKFTLLSGHDMTLAILLFGIGCEELDVPPPFASHISVEIWRLENIDYIRFVFNGDIIPLKGKDMIPYKEFKEEMNRKYQNNVTQEL
ncbi:histidine acid phosphatase [Histomonas meleagridis]|uniref:histidine acid phosphatase n=1 Tax=Histomonas meleagridis TaxID=135588 RepID=UPI00355943BD|nr:histidine acid phosphatase [Histomonas meleagridis]KAH0807170.1 histidine acid phosphatase [Histomonas meleagridis]